MDLYDMHIAPEFSLPIYTVSLPEDAEIGTLVTKVHATDVDIGINRKINYTFIDSFNEHFHIISDSGIITLAKPLDREGKRTWYKFLIFLTIYCGFQFKIRFFCRLEKEMYNLTVQAFDHGDPRLSSLAYVIVNVNDINDSEFFFDQFEL